MRNSFIRIVTFFLCSFVVLYFGFARLFPEPVDDADIAAVKEAISAQIVAGKTEILVSEVFPAGDFSNSQLCMRSFEGETGGYGIIFFFSPSSNKDAGKKTVQPGVKVMKTFIRSVRAGDRGYNFKFDNSDNWACAPYTRAVFNVVQDAQTKRSSLILAEKP